MKPARLVNRRQAGAALGVAGLAGWITRAAAQAAAPRRYATMSLIGDQLTAIQRAEVTGTRLDRNDITEIKVRGDVIDRAALGAVNAAIMRQDPGAKPLSLLVDEPVLYAQQARLFDGGHVRLPLSLVQAARDGAATHVLLLTKHRAELKFDFTIGGRTGQGTASGLGFYVDSARPVVDLQNNRTVEGFFGLYVHVRATVVDLATEAVVGDRRIVETEMYINSREGFGGLPWDALPPAEKVRAVSEVLLKSLREQIPALLAA